MDSCVDDDVSYANTGSIDNSFGACSSQMEAHDTPYTSGKVSVVLSASPTILAVDSHNRRLQAAPSVSLRLGRVFRAHPTTSAVTPEPREF